MLTPYKPLWSFLLFPGLPFLFPSVQVLDLPEWDPSAVASSYSSITYFLTTHRDRRCPSDYLLWHTCSFVLWLCFCPCLVFPCYLEKDVLSRGFYSWGCWGDRKTDCNCLTLRHVSCSSRQIIPWRWSSKLSCFLTLTHDSYTTVFGKLLNINWNETIFEMASYFNFNLRLSSFQIWTELEYKRCEIFEECDCKIPVYSEKHVATREAFSISFLWV